MADGPTLTYTYHFFLKPLGNSQFQVYSDGTNGGGSITDIPDAGTMDNLAVLGDISNDHFEFDGNSADTAVYIGQTASGGGIVSTQNDMYGKPFYNLSTNAKYTYGQKITVSQTPYELPCFASGTLIETTRGKVAVEALAIGDLVVTSAGLSRPIRWLGHRTVDCRRHSDKSTVMPVRIAAQAFGVGRPSRDLFVSPGHAICVDLVGEVLIPAAALVNGCTVAQVEVDSVAYWHVELDSHDILLAENLPAESYLEMGNRTFFSEPGVVALAALPDSPVSTHADFCRPFVGAGSVVDLVRSRLRERAVAAGWTLAEGSMSDVHVVADGRMVRPDTEGLSARFVLPADAKDVWLVSEAGVPSQLGVSADDRRLGLCLRGLSIDDGLTPLRNVAMDDACLSVGFHACEEGVRRWTAGRARLPATLWAGCRGQFFLRVDLETALLPHWQGPTIQSESVCTSRIASLRVAN